MITVTYGSYTLILDADGLPTPERLTFFRMYAELYERFTQHGEDLRTCFVAVRRNDAWWPALPFLVVTQDYQMQLADPGVLLLPETHLLLIGAGRRLLAYRLDQPARLWEEHVENEFFSWQRHGDVIIMAGMDELAAWDVRGLKLWTAFPQQQWSYSVEEENVLLDVGGQITRFGVRSGPAH